MKRGRLRTRMMAGILTAILCPALLSCALAAYFGWQHQRQAVEHNLLSLAQSRKSQLISTQQSREHDLEVFMKIPLFNTQIRDYLRRTNANEHADAVLPTSDTQRALLSKTFNDVNKTHRRFKKVFLVDISGEVVASSDPTLLGKFQGNEPYFQTCLRIARQPVAVKKATKAYSNVIKGAIINIAVRNEHGAVLGVLAGEARLSEFSAVTSEMSDASGPSAESFIVDNHRVLVTPMRDKLLTPGTAVIKEPIVPDSKKDELVHMATYENYAGKMVLGAYAWVEPLQLLIVAEQDMHEALQPVINLILLTGGVALLTLIFMAALALGFTGRITRPVAHLADVARQISAGNLSLRAEEIPYEELAMLGRAFNSMTDQLQANMQGLEERVNELQEAKTQLTDYAGALETQIAERKKAEEERDQMEHKMLQAQKLESLGVLAGGIAHDFNNLLTGIMGNTELAKLRAPVDEPLRKSLDQIMLGSQRAAELAGQMLAYSGKGKFVVESVQLKELIEAMEPLLRVSISKRCSLEIIAGTELGRVAADAVQLRQVLMNLVINASEAMEEKPGRIVVSSGEKFLSREALAKMAMHATPAPGMFAWLEVSDQGCGMSAETRERIFDPFYTTKFTGRGLGLAAVLGIVHGHEGTIDIQSVEGAGSTFTLYLPLDQSEKPMTKKPETIADSKPFHGSGTVLVVDDEATVRSVAAMMIEHMGFRVLQAANGEDGLALFKAEEAEIAIALIDLTMPVMDGETLMHALRPLSADLKIILTSGYTQDAMDPALRGFDGFLAKPYQYKEMVEVLRQCQHQPQEANGA